MAGSQQEPWLARDEAEYLNTPRLVADAAQTTVWRWDQAEPFAATTANEDPDGDSAAFDLPIRLPGQYFDKETGLHQNYFRDYDPSLGRYEESDPIGLRGGLNTYTYVMNNALKLVDPLGLDVLVCFYGNAAGGIGHVGFGAPGGGTSGFYPAQGESAWGGAGVVLPDTQPPNRRDACKIIPAKPWQDECMAKCQISRVEIPGTYHLTERNCTLFVRECFDKCGLPSTGRGSDPATVFERLPGIPQRRR